MNQISLMALIQLLTLVSIFFINANKSLLNVIRHLRLF